MTISTNSSLHVLGIVGSLRVKSYNRGLLRAAIELAPPGLDIQIFDRLGEIPLYSQDIEEEGDPEPVTAFKEAIRQADALLVATPEYNYNIPGVLKNAIDWASRPPEGSVLNEKPAAILGASPGGTGTARSQLALRQAFLFTRTLVLPSPEVMVARVHEKFDENGVLQHEVTRRRIQDLLNSLAVWIQKFRMNLRAAA
jgi:chromate reductase, NAD(P)H dehydrogenase (quinone)